MSHIKLQRLLVPPPRTTMSHPKIALGERDVVLAYEDSGVPGSSTTYTTVFLVNSYVWHAGKDLVRSRQRTRTKRRVFTGIFRPMFPHAADYNLRIVGVNVREYAGSSPFTEEELAVLHSGDEEDEATALRDQGTSLAMVVAHVIKQDNLPRPSVSAGKKAGGVVIISRGSGGANLISLLGNLDALDKSVYTLLDEYVTLCILHGE